MCAFVGVGIVYGCLWVTVKFCQNHCRLRLGNASPVTGDINLVSIQAICKVYNVNLYPVSECRHIKLISMTRVIGLIM